LGATSLWNISFISCRKRSIKFHLLCYYLGLCFWLNWIFSSDPRAQRSACGFL
jgi:hypothetical protein